MTAWGCGCKACHGRHVVWHPDASGCPICGTHPPRSPRCIGVPPRRRLEHPRLMAMRKPLLEPARSAFGVRSQQLPLFCFRLLPNAGINQRRKAVAAATALQKRAAPAGKGACFLTRLGYTCWVGAMGKLLRTRGRMTSHAETWRRVYLATPERSGEFTSPCGGVRPPRKWRGKRAATGRSLPRG